MPDDRVPLVRRRHHPTRPRPHLAPPNLAVHRAGAVVLMNRKILQDDQHYETAADGTARWQRISVEERWESLKPDGSVWTSEATREDLIHHHLQSNAHFADHAEWLKEHPHIEGHEFNPVPLARIRKVTRYETGSAWEVVSDVEDLDEMTELLNQPPCQHPVDKIHDGLCHRCCERVA